MNDLAETTKPSVEIKPLFGLSLAELTALMNSFGQKPYRASQLFEALYRQRITSLDQATTLPQNLRDTLAAEGYTIGLPEIVQTARSIDGTERYLIRMADGETVETVWMPDGDGGERGDGSQAAEEEEAEDSEARTGKPAAAFPYRRSTICVSSQVGCAVNCQSASDATSPQARSPVRSPQSSTATRSRWAARVALTPRPASTSSSWVWANRFSTTPTSWPPSAFSPSCRFLSRG
jgi:hypothetical protein